MFNFFKALKTSLISRQSAFPQLRVEYPAIYIGDIHGELEKLDKLLANLITNLPDIHETQLVFLGDYIDRGEQSAQVLEWLIQLQSARPETIFLKGNHEDFFLKFLSDPNQSSTAQWLRHGGLQTLSSFGIALTGAPDKDGGYASLHNSLLNALPVELDSFLNQLQAYHINGNLVATHAGTDPDIDISETPGPQCSWGHPRCYEKPRADGCWSIHGHIVENRPMVFDTGRISIDTGAYANGPLTAAYVTPDSSRPAFFSSSN